MSDNSNTNLIERAAYVSEQYEGTYLPKAIDNLIKLNDLEALEFMVREAEAELAREDFYNNDAMPPSYNPSDDATVLSDVRGEIEASDVY